MVYQEMLTFPNLSVSANIFAGRELTSAGRLREADMRERTRDVLARLHLNLDPDAPADSLSAAHRQLLQVARALAFTCRILVLDEPTTALTDAEADHLFAVLEGLRRDGTTLLYVSHRLQEVFRLCDRITVLRDGALVGTFTRTEVTQEAISARWSEGNWVCRGRQVRLVGRDRPRPARPAAACRPCPLELRALTRAPCFADVSLTVARGEDRRRCSGWSARDEPSSSRPCSACIGRAAASCGSRDAASRGGRRATRRRAGVALVPEERQRQGLFFNLDLRHNLVLPQCAVRGAVRIRREAERDEARQLLRDWRIKAPALEAMPDALSGGNQQKVVLAKWLATAAARAAPRRADQGRGRRCEVRDSRDDPQRSPPTGWPCSWCRATCPKCFRSPIASSSCARAMVRGELPGADATEESVMQPAALHLKRRHVRADGRRRGSASARDPPVELPARPAPSRFSILEVLFFTWYLWPDAGRAHPFFNLENALLVLKYSSIYGIAAVGAAVVIISGGIDLAPGAVIALAGVVTSGLFVQQGVPLGVSVAAGLLDGRAARARSRRCWSSLVGLPPFIATLGVMGIARGTAFIITEGRYYDVSGKLPPGWQPLGLPQDWLAPIVMIAMAVVFHVLMTRFQWGRAVSSIGGNETAALYSGLAIGRVKTSVYVLSGVLAAAAGIVLVIIQGQGKADLATGYELDIIASAVVGGASLSGGRGSVVGAVLGTLIFGVLRNALPQIPGCRVLRPADRRGRRHRDRRAWISCCFEAARR